MRFQEALQLAAAHAAIPRDHRQDFLRDRARTHSNYCETSRPPTLFCKVCGKRQIARGDTEETRPRDLRRGEGNRMRQRTHGDACRACLASNAMTPINGTPSRKAACSASTISSCIRAMNWATPARSHAAAWLWESSSNSPVLQPSFATPASMVSQRGMLGHPRTTAVVVLSDAMRGACAPCSRGWSRRCEVDARNHRASSRLTPRARGSSSPRLSRACTPARRQWERRCTRALRS